MALAEAQRIAKRVAQDKAAWWQWLGPSGAMGCVKALVFIPGGKTLNC